MQKTEFKCTMFVSIQAFVSVREKVDYNKLKKLRERDLLQTDRGSREKTNRY